jgi:hypothetical protein
VTSTSLNPRWTNPDTAAASFLIPKDSSGII